MMEGNKTRLQQYKGVCHKYLVIENDEYIDVIFGVVFANRTDSKPVWLYIVGPPGCGKTEILQTLSGSTEIYAISSITENTLISGKVLKPGESDPSLVPKLHKKTLIIKDLTAMLGAPSKKVMHIMGQLRDAYDGTCRNAYGTGKDTEYTSKFGLMAAVTNVIDKHRGVMASLGERFLAYRCPELSEDETRKRCRIAAANIHVEQQEKELAQAARHVLKNRRTPAELSNNMLERIIDIAEYVAKARCSVSRDQFTKEPDIPTAEVPTRLTKQLCDIAVGIATAREKSDVTNSELKLVQKIAIDCLTLKRIKLLKCLFHQYPVYRKTSEIAPLLNLSPSMVARWLEDLDLLGLVEKKGIDRNEKIIPLESCCPNMGYAWRLVHVDILKPIWGQRTEGFVPNVPP
jgi:hypothetical protein